MQCKCWVAKLGCSHLEVERCGFWFSFTLMSVPRGLGHVPLCWVSADILALKTERVLCDGRREGGH